VTPDNVIRFDNEPNPSTFTYTTNVGGLVGGDTLSHVAVTVPSNSVQALGGDVFALISSNATFATGTASNYALNYTNGLLLVLPRPQYVENTNLATFLVVDPQQEAQTLLELQHQQTSLLSDSGNNTPPGTTGNATPPASNNPATSSPNGSVTPATPQSPDSITTESLRGQPLLNFDPLAQNN
jgi:hypothetical protein